MQDAQSHFLKQNGILINQLTGFESDLKDREALESSVDLRDVSPPRVAGRPSKKRRNDDWRKASCGVVHDKGSELQAA